MAARPPLIALKGVRLQDGQRPLFDGVDLAIEPRTRACLVGRNGAGKSTLMKIIMGQIEPDSGERAVQSGVRFAYVPQEPVITGETLLDYAISGDAESWTAEAWLHTFGLDPEKSALNLSGGEIRRAALAKAFAEEPDLMLLDEPTNHLDILAIELLEEELISARCAVLVVSHDRAFLNRVTQTCHWLEGRRVRSLNKSFDAFDEWSTKVTGEEAQSLQRLTRTIERETETFYRSITAAPATRVAPARLTPCGPTARNGSRMFRASSISASIPARPPASWSPTSRASPRPSAIVPSSSPSPPASSAVTASPSSAPTARARPPWSRSCSANSPPTRARSSWVPISSRSTSTSHARASAVT